MDEPGSLRDSVERLVLAGLGAAALTSDRIDQLAGRLAERGSLSRDEARAELQEAALRWRGEAHRVGERASAGLEGLFRELGLVSHARHEELELRIAQLEHRLRLLEGAPQGIPGPPH